MHVGEEEEGKGMGMLQGGGAHCWDLWFEGFKRLGVLKEISIKYLSAYASVPYLKKKILFIYF